MFSCSVFWVLKKAERHGLQCSDSPPICLESQEIRSCGEEKRACAPAMARPQLLLVVLLGLVASIAPTTALTGATNLTETIIYPFLMPDVTPNKVPDRIKTIQTLQMNHSVVLHPSICFIPVKCQVSCAHLRVHFLSDQSYFNCDR